MRKYLLVLLVLSCAQSSAQRQIYKEIELGDNPNYLSSIELSPDGKTLALGAAKGNILFWDVETQQVMRKLAFDGFPHGPYMSYSPDGRYLLLIEQYFTDWALNKDRPSRASVLEIESGKLVLTKDGAHVAAISPDSQSLVTLEGEEIIFWNIASGGLEKKFRPANASNAFALSPDGSSIVVAQRPEEDDLKYIPSIRNDKKAIKEALKYREIAVFYDTKSFQRKFIADDIMDIIFSMRFSADGKSLYLFNAPNTKFRSSAGSARNAYVQVVGGADGVVSRTMFPTNATEPIYKESASGAYFALTSVEHQQTVNNSLLVFDRESGQTLKRFKNDFRFSENIVIGRASFEFLPDGKTMAVGYGNRLVLWNID